MVDGGSIRAAVVQVAPGGDTAANLEQAEAGVAAAARRGATLVVLPEKWPLLGDAEVLHAGAEDAEGPALGAACAWAREHGIWLVAGSIATRVPGRDLLRNLSSVVSPEGEVVAQYAKLHMFDVDVEGVRYRESDGEEPGSEVVTVDAADVRLGLSVCYDLRFPELYRLLALAGARVLCVPAAFTERTGRDHWEPLLRARAIENQCFVLAAGAYGDLGGGRVSHGRSMIVDPWGTVLAQVPDGGDVAVADLRLDDVDRVRASIPSLRQRRPDVYAIRGEG